MGGQFLGLAIVIEADTAVVHYFAVVVRQDWEGKNKRTVDGIVETLTRSGGAWKFLTLTGF